MVDELDATEGGLLTVWPRQVCGTWGERLVVPLVDLLLLANLPHPLVRALPFASLAGANGQLMAWRREAYDRVGGHAALPAQVLEDVRLAQRAKRLGVALTLRLGGPWVATRMYRGWRDVVAGFGKNALAAAGGVAGGLAGGVGDQPGGVHGAVGRRVGRPAVVVARGGRRRAARRRQRQERAAGRRGPAAAVRADRAHRGRGTGARATRRVRLEGAGVPVRRRASRWWAAGFAGLAAAIDLARAGADVVLLERADEVGGKAGEWRAGGFRFDVGPSVFTLPDVVDALFRDAGRERPFELRPLEPLCRYVYPSGRVWDVYTDLERTLAGLDAQEGAAYRRALAAARRLYEDAAPTFVRGRAPGLARLAAYGVRHGWRAHPGRTLPDLLAALGVRGDLLAFFLRFATYFGGDPYRAPAVLHNIAWVELGLGVTLPVGGVHGVVRALRALAEDLGVEVRTGVAVEALPVRGGRVREVATDRGTLAVDAVVAAVDRRWALGWLGRAAPERRHPSLSGTVALLGVRGTTTGLAAHTILFPRGLRRRVRRPARRPPPARPHALRPRVVQRRPGGRARRARELVRHGERARLAARRDRARRGRRGGAAPALDLGGTRLRSRRAGRGRARPRPGGPRALRGPRRHLRGGADDAGLDAPAGAPGPWRAQPALGRRHGAPGRRHAARAAVRALRRGGPRARARPGPGRSSATWGDAYAARARCGARLAS